MKKTINIIGLLIGLGLIFGISFAQNTNIQEHGAAPNINRNNYKKTIIYLGKEDDELNLGFQQNFDKQQIFFQQIFLPEKKNFSEEIIMNEITEHLTDIKATKTLIINTNNFDVLFQLLGKTNSTDNLNLKDKDIYLITDTNRFFLKRILAKYINGINVEKIYTIPANQTLNFLSTLSLNKLTKQEQYITAFSLTFQETPKFLLISYLIDNLISKGFPIDVIGILLILGVGSLIISIFRQVIGFSVFGIYSPMLFALSMAALGIPTTLLLFCIGCIAKFLTDIFCKKIYLLHNAKTTLLIVIYLLLFLGVIGLDSIYNTNLISLNIFNTMFSIFPIIFIIIVIDKVFNEGFKIFSLGRWSSLVEFFIVSFIVLGLINRNALKYILLSFPEAIVVILILNIFIGRFTGLQLLEYLRFMPLMKKHFDSEEE